MRIQKKSWSTKLKKYLLGEYYPRRCYCKKIIQDQRNKTVKIIPRDQDSWSWIHYANTIIPNLNQ